MPKPYGPAENDGITIGPSSAPANDTSPNCVISTTPISADRSTRNPATLAGVRVSWSAKNADENTRVPVEASSPRL